MLYRDLSQIQKMAMRSFLNSFVRDFNGESFLHVTEKELIISSSKTSISIPIESYSLLGLHQYTGEVFNQKKEKLAYSDLVSFVGKVCSASEKFVEYSISSFEEIKNIIETTKDKSISNYLESEQLLRLGHPLHPFSKLKGNISKEDIYNYSPEYQNGFKLKWIEVSENIISLIRSDQSSIFDNLVKFDRGETKNCIPMHPLQYSSLIEEGFKVNGIALEKLPLAEGMNDWFACSSMRTLYCENAPCYLKFSLPVKLTNSVRVLNSNDLKRTNVINKIFEDDSLEAFEAKYPQFHIQLESTFGGVVENTQIIDKTIFQLREPLRGNEGDSFLLASLCEDTEVLFKLIKESKHWENSSFPEIYRIRSWFSEFLNVAIKPLFGLAFEEGILLGAHLQNLILSFSKGSVIGSEYRDCQGTGLTQTGGERFKDLVKQGALVIQDSDVNKVFGYYLVVNTLFSVIASLAQGEKQSELILLNELRSFFLKLKKEMPKGSAFFDYWILEEKVFQKGNFRCSLNISDENTMDNPWGIYNLIKNPLTYLRPLRKYGFEVLHKRASLRNGKVLSLRKLDLERDLDKFHEWHNKEFVSEFWELNKSKEELREYVQNLYASHYQLPVIIDLEGEAIGYFEVYWAFDDRIAPYCDAEMYDRGVHILIGEERILRTRYVFECLDILTEFCFLDEEFTENVWGEPRADNKNVLKFAQALPGWEVLHEFSFPHKRARLLRCNRLQRQRDVQND